MNGRNVLAAALIVVTLALALLLAAGIAQGRAGMVTYDIPWDVYSSGGDEMTSANYTLHGGPGQAIADNGAGAAYQVQAGYWYGLVQTYRVYLPAVTRY